MVLLVFLAIVWAAVGVYWLKTRVPTPSMAFGVGGRRPNPLGTLAAIPSVAPRRTATVLPLHAMQSLQSAASRHLQAPAHKPGHSLSQPARRAAPQTSVRPVLSSEQARLRRRNVLVALFAFAALSLLGVLTVGGTTAILVHLMADALLLGFILLIVQYQREIELERTQNRPVYAEPRPVQGQFAATGTDGRLH